jgi:hypothetical protein
MRRQVKVGLEFDLLVSGVDSTPDSEKADEKKARRAHLLAVGREFEATVEISEMRTRAQLAWASLGMIGGSLLGAAAFGMHVNDFSALEHVWSAAAPFAGGIFSYFFTRTGGRRK